MEHLLNVSLMSAFFQVVLIDIALAADNAVVVGLAASGLPPDERRKALIVGIAGATIMRIAFASITVQLLQLTGLILAGGILLLWVCWKMWREMHPAAPREVTGSIGHAEHGAQAKTLKQAIIQIIIADISMSLDNVLAVAGAGRDHPSAVVFGLALSIVMMGFAAMMIARLLERHRWIAYVGLLVVLFVALRMIWEGGHEVAHAVAGV